MRELRLGLAAAGIAVGVLLLAGCSPSAPDEVHSSAKSSATPSAGSSAAPSPESTSSDSDPLAASRWDSALDKSLVYVGGESADGYYSAITFADDDVVGYGIEYRPPMPTDEQGFDDLWAKYAGNGVEPGTRGCPSPITDFGWVDVGNPTSNPFLILYQVVSATANTITVKSTSLYNGNVRNEVYIGYSAPAPPTARGACVMSYTESMDLANQLLNQRGD